MEDFESNIKSGEGASKSGFNAAEYQAGADFQFANATSGHLPMGPGEFPDCQLVDSRTANQCDTIPGLPNETPETPEQRPVFPPPFLPPAVQELGVDRTPPTPPYLPMPPAFQDIDRNPAVVAPTPHDFGGRPPVFRPTETPVDIGGRPPVFRPTETPVELGGRPRIFKPGVPQLK